MAFNLLSTIKNTFELIRHHQHRIWTNEDRIHIELRAFNSHQLQRFEKILTQELVPITGIYWLSLNKFLNKLIVSFDTSQLDAGQVIEHVQRLEKQIGLDDTAFHSPSSYPGEQEPVLRTWIELGASCAGLCAGTAIRLLPQSLQRLAQAPAWVQLAALNTAAESFPEIRNPLQKTIGTGNTELLLSLTKALGEGVLSGWSGSITDMVFQYQQLKEIRARQAIWRRWEPALCGDPVLSEAWQVELSDVESMPTVSGQLDDYIDDTSQMTLGAFSFGLVASHSFEQASTPVFSTTPKPALVGREGFVTEVSQLLIRHNILVMDKWALRHLDKIKVLAIDAELLNARRGAVSYIHRLLDIDINEVTSRVESLFDPERPLETTADEEYQLAPLALDQLAPNFHTAIDAKLLEMEGLSFLGLTRQEIPVAIVGVFSVVDSVAELVVSRLREAGLQLAIVHRGGKSKLWTHADLEIQGNATLAEFSQLRERNLGVAYISAKQSAGLQAANISLGLRIGPTIPWGADLLSAQGLEDGILLLEAICAARKNVKQSIDLAKIEAFSGMILSLRQLERSTLQRVKLAASLTTFAALLNGIRNGRHLKPIPAGIQKDPTPWHALPAKTAMDKLHSSLDGISQQLALEKHVPFVDTTPSPWQQLSATFVEELANPLAPILVAGAGLSALTGALTDAGMISSVVVLNAAIGAYQRYRTESSLSALDKQEAAPVRIVRDGTTQLHPVDQTVVGDILYLEAGEVVPADCRVVYSKALEVDESSLTGESVPVKKHTRPNYSMIIADRSSMLYAGTTIAAGTGKALVIAIGQDTEAHRGLMLRPNKARATGVEARLDSITDLTAPMAAFSGLAVMASGIARNQPTAEMISGGVSLAVAAVPEGLPLLATMAQLGAAKRLSNIGALARNPRAIEALGRINVLCADKTGTLTEGKLQVQAISDGLEIHSIEAPGAAQLSILRLALRATPDGSNQDSLPHYTDQALIEGAKRHDIVESSLKNWQRINELPFKSERGFHATLGSEIEGTNRICVKGAPEILLPKCTSYFRDGKVTTLSDNYRYKLERHSHRLAERGLRVLAVVERSVRIDKKKLKDRDLHDLTFRGFIGISDPVRATACKAVETLSRCGIEVKMITGDHPTTAIAIAKQLQLKNAQGVLTGPDLDKLSDGELAEKIASISVFARVTPAQKARIVTALQNLNQVVAMTGDGTNDAPAIRLADVGIALGEKSTASARAAADLLVVDERIETIVEAVYEGKALWSSVKDAVALLVGGNLGEIGFTLFAGLASGGSPINARQLLLVNLLTDVLPALAVALRRTGNLPPEQLAQMDSASMLGGALENDIKWRALVTAGSTTISWYVARWLGTERSAGTVALLTLVGTQLGQTLLVSKGSRLVLLTSAGSLAAMLALVQTPIISQFFGCRPLTVIGLSQAGVATILSTIACTGLPYIKQLRTNLQDNQAASKNDTAFELSEYLAETLAAVKKRFLSD